jgi:excisionase family DNA binding protein
METEPISTAEAARLLGCSSKTVQRMIERKILHGWKLMPGTKSVYQVRREDVEKLLKQREAVAK